MLRSRAKARLAVLFYAVNPASVFFSAAYSESVFFLCTLAGHVAVLPVLSSTRSTLPEAIFAATTRRCRPYLPDDRSVTPSSASPQPPQQHSARVWPLAAASLAFAGAAATRSNGALLALFVLAPSAFELLDAVICLCRSRHRQRLGAGFALRMAVAGMLAMLVLAPHAAFQLHGASIFCSNASHPRPWCDNIFPSSYAFVQRTYWNLGLFQFYDLKQVRMWAWAWEQLHCCC